jgi:hypothetical protein
VDLDLVVVGVEALKMLVLVDCMVVVLVVPVEELQARRVPEEMVSYLLHTVLIFLQHKS